jgi:lipopolysaccharide export system ATP-binding protein
MAMGFIESSNRRSALATRLVSPESESFNPLSVISLDLRVGKRAILSDVSLDVARSEIVGLLGRDGAGKTSCFEAIAGLRRADSGRVLLNGLDVTDQPIEARARLGLSYLCEEASIFRSLTVEENIEIALEAARTDNSTVPQRVDSILEKFQIDHVRKQLATSLSGGERRRCEIARAVATDPAAVLMDEPFRGLDPMSIREVKETVLRLKQTGAGVLISDYNVKGMIDVMDRVYVLHEGSIVFEGPSCSMVDNPIVRHVYLGEGYVL